MKLKFTKMGINGEGIGYLNKMPVFCDAVIPGETAEIRITEKNARYSRAELVSLSYRSRERVRPVCPHQKGCGACPLMIMNYEAQCRAKKDLLEEALYKYGNVKRHFVRDLHPSPAVTGCRNQCKLPVQESEGKLVTGMYRPGTNHFRPIEDCCIHDPLLETVRKNVLNVLNQAHFAAYDSRRMKGLRYLVLRAVGGNVQCTLITGKDQISDELIAELSAIPSLNGLFQSVNTARKGTGLFGSKIRRLSGDPVLPVTIGDITLDLSPESFFQLNTEQAVSMYETAVSKIDRCDLMVEAYCGVGAMSLLAHKKAKKIIGIESVESAVRNALSNAEKNGITNTEFLCMDASDGLLRASRTQPVDVLLADPPRSGMDERMIETIMTVLPKKIIYISCNPSTLAKNLKELKHAYHVVTVIPFDLFPQTAHVESITVLELG